ncbi:MAG: diadenylate cyclase CdaA [Lachnospiraceae bacterium]|nr:diadenylate cyclase CdaA [Lachnospiraceae bacterium]
MDFGDVLEIVLIAVLIYYILLWMKNTRAWALLRGIIVIGIFLLIADILEMNTILWIAQNALGFVVTALIVVMQPELRRALEELGKRSIVASIIPFDNGRIAGENITSDTIDEIVTASVEMGRARTGALIVIEKSETLRQYEQTGIDVDAKLTSQLLINIFEHNTPLHDGAVIVRGNRVVSATCYLPLSDNLGISKELGTRHRAGLGVSEATDSVTVIVSEETGKITVAYEGELNRNLNAEKLRECLVGLLIGSTDAEKGSSRIKWKGRNRS